MHRKILRKVLYESFDVWRLNEFGSETVSVLTQPLHESRDLSFSLLDQILCIVTILSIHFHFFGLSRVEMVLLHVEIPLGPKIRVTRANAHEKVTSYNVCHDAILSFDSYWIGLFVERVIDEEHSQTSLEHRFDIVFRQKVVPHRVVGMWCHILVKNIKGCLWNGHRWDSRSRRRRRRSRCHH